MDAVESGRVFQLVAGHPALDFVNTLDWRFRAEGPEELLASYGDLAGFAEQAGLLTAKQARKLLREAGERRCDKVLAEARELREAMAAVFYGVVDGRKAPAPELKKLEDAFRAARREQELAAGEGRFAWRLTAEEPAPELPLWLVTLEAEELATSDQMALLRACAKEDCRWLFLDTSKNHTRRWCDMKICGNRMKARRFKAQHAAEG